MQRSMNKALFTVVASLTACLTMAWPLQARTPWQESARNRDALFRGRVLITPQPQERILLDLKMDATDTWKLTGTETDVRDLTFTNGCLKFRMGADQATLEWRSAPGAKAPALTWQGGAFLACRMKQDATNALPWQAQFTYDGDPRDTGAMIRLVSGSIGDTMIPLMPAREWTTRETRIHQVAQANGLRLTVSAPKDSWVEINALMVIQRDYGVWARKTLVLPDEPIFSALASSSIGQDIWINGHRVYEYQPAFPGANWYQFTTVDLLPYLKPGANVIAIHDPMDLPKTPTCWIQGAVVMASGVMIAFQSDANWKTSGRFETNWQETAFHDAHWAAPGTKDPTKFLDPALKVITKHGRWFQPAYEGVIDLRRPGGGRFYYSEGAPVAFNARIPPGLARGETRLDWEVWNEKMGLMEKQGEVGMPGGSNVAATCEINAGLLKGGVYSLVVRKQGHDGESFRRMETFMVTRKIPMRQAEDADWDAGCKLTLVDAIDCTNPNDPHPFQDPGLITPAAATRVVERNGLRYRESTFDNDRGSTNSWFAYRLKLKHKDRPHWIVVWYPDDTNRFIECQLQPFFEVQPGQKTPLTAMAGFGVKAGLTYPNTHRLQPLRAIFWSQQLEPVLLITKALSLGRVAAAKIEVFEIADLPELKVHRRGREFGLLTERSTVVPQSFGPSAAEVFTTHKDRFTVFPEPPSEEYILNPYLAWFEAAENYARYCRFTGQNAFFQGAYMYTRNPPYLTGAEGSRLVPEVREVVLNVLQANEIGVYGYMEYYCHDQDFFKKLPSLTQARNGADLTLQINSEGLIPKTYGPPPENPMTSPLARNSLSNVIDLAIKPYASYPGFKGMILAACPTWLNPCYVSDSTSLDDHSFHLFESETGLKAPVEDSAPDRFKQRYQWIQAKARAHWLDWRSQKMRAVHEGVAAQLKAIRPDWEYLVIYEPVYNDLNARYDRREITGRDILRTYGYDPVAFKGVTAFSFGRDVWSFDPPPELASGISRWEYLRDPEFVELFNDNAGKYRVGLVRTGFDEWANMALQKYKPPLWAYSHQIIYTYPALPYQMHRFTSMLIDHDTDIMLYGICDCGSSLGGEEGLRRFVGELVSLPKGRFEPLRGDGFDPNISAGELRQDGRYFVLLANPGWWPADVTLTTRDEGKEPVRRARTDERVRLRNHKATFHLAPYDVIGLYADEDTLKPQKIEVRIPENSKAWLQGALDRMKTIKGSEAALRNAEAALAAGDLVHAWQSIIQDNRAWGALQ